MPKLPNVSSMRSLLSSSSSEGTAGSAIGLDRQPHTSIIKVHSTEIPVTCLAVMDSIMRLCAAAKARDRQGPIPREAHAGTIHGVLPCCSDVRTAHQACAWPPPAPRRYRRDDDRRRCPSSDGSVDSVAGRLRPALRRRRRGRHDCRALRSAGGTPDGPSAPNAVLLDRLRRRLGQWPSSAFPTAVTGTCQYG